MVGEGKIRINGTTAQKWDLGLKVVERVSRPLKMLQWTVFFSVDIFTSEMEHSKGKAIIVFRKCLIVHKSV